MGIVCFIEVHFIALFIYYIFYKLKVCGNPALKSLLALFFLIVSAHVTSQCHILVIFTILQTFS